MQSRDSEIVSCVQQILDQLRRVMEGKDEQLLWALAAILARGHILLEDIPGVGKTTMALSFARTLDLEYGRVQFTPDVLPSDITGYCIPEPQTGQLRYHPGAVLCNLFLADELNRATSRTQSALLEAMEEGQVTVDGVTHELPRPFVVIATQNPLGAAGTQRLPDSQVDRFTLRLRLGYPDPASEMAMIRFRQNGNPLDQLRPVLTRERLLALQQLVEKTYLSDSVIRYAVELIGATRRSELLSRGGQSPSHAVGGGHGPGHRPAPGPGLCGARRYPGGIRAHGGPPADALRQGGKSGQNRRGRGGGAAGKADRPPAVLICRGGGYWQRWRGWAAACGISPAAGGWPG